MEFEKVRAIVAAQMNITEKRISMDTTFSEDLGADSLDIFQIVSELENAFDMDFSNEDAERIKTVGDVVEYIRAREQ